MRPEIRLLAAAGGLLVALTVPGTAAAVSPSRASADAWERVTTAAGRTPALPRAVAPRRFAAFAVDRAALRQVLRAVPREEAGGGRPTIAIPRPDGRFERFALAESPVLEPGLARRHPGIRTYVGRGVADRTAALRLSVTPLGVHAAVLSARGAWYVDPQFRGNGRRHVSYHRTALPKPPSYEQFARNEPVGAHGAHGAEDAGASPTKAHDGPRVDLRVYRLALVSDPTYALNSGANDGLDPAAPNYQKRLSERTTAAKAVLMHRVNQLYEADFGARMVLIDATDRLNLNTTDLASGANGPCGPDACFTASQLSTCGSGLLTRNAFVTGMIAGARNFDVGHIILGRDGGGIAQLGVVGDSNKARGCTGLPKPIGDFFAVDYVAHELGHQFGGNHTFNGVNGACAATNRNLGGAAAVEPGSGTTVMAYAGICRVDDLQAHSDPYFSQYSIREMGAYIAGPDRTRSSVQQVALQGFDGTDTLVLTYDRRSSAPLARGGDYTAAGVKAAIEALLPAGGTVTVAGLNGTAFGDSGFQATFGGTLAGTPVALLKADAKDAGTVVGETVAGGPTTHGGSEVRATRNHAPDVEAASAFVVPLRTPFKLTAEATDADGDAVTFLWEQNDGGPPAVGDPLLSTMRVTGPLFRVFGTAARYAHPDDTYKSPSPGSNVATTDPSRTFPDLAQVVADNTNALTGSCPPPSPAETKVPEPPASPTGARLPDPVVDCLSEVLPTASWVGLSGTGTMRFRVTARDNGDGAGGVDQAETVLVLAKGAGPFRVLGATQPPAPAGDARSLAVVWDVARTDVLTGTPNVRISLSADGGRTFPHVLAASTANDGNQTVTLPAGLKTASARVKVEAVGNVFFDVSHTDLALDTTGR